MIPEADIHPLASWELEEATLFYDRRVKGLGQRFLRAVEICRDCPPEEGTDVLEGSVGEVIADV